MKTITPSKTNHATIDEFTEAFMKLTQAQEKALHVHARECLIGTPYTSSMDLIHEVIHRVNEGHRKWPIGVPIDAFLYNTFRSIASSARMKSEMKNLPIDSLDENDRCRPINYEPVSSAEDVALLNERKREAFAAIKRARSHFEWDIEALQVLDGILADMDAKEIKAQFNLGDAAYKKARQRLINQFKAWAKRNTE